MTIKQAAMWLCQPGIVSMIHDPTTKKALSVAVKALAEPELGTNLAEVGTDLARTVKGFPVDADMLMLKVEEEYGFRARDRLYGIIRNMPKYELPSAQSEPCEDAVSREQAKAILYNFAGCVVDTPGGHYNKAYKAAMEQLEELPPVTPKQRTGKWIPIERQWHCSVCDGIAPKGYRWTYCPSCGAKMEVTE